MATSERAKTTWATTCGWSFPGCHFAAGLDVRPVRSGFCADLGNIGVFALEDFQPGDLLIIERSLLSLDDPPEAFRQVLPQLHPRSGRDRPMWLFCLPIGPLLASQAFMTFLKLQLNMWWNGIFAFGSLTNHSCQPNAIRQIFDDGWSVVLCVRPIKAGEEVLTSYLSELDKSGWQRRLEVFCKYGFLCTCPRCTANAPLPTPLSLLKPELSSHDVDFSLRNIQLLLWSLAGAEAAKAELQQNGFPAPATTRQNLAKAFILARDVGCQDDLAEELLRCARLLEGSSDISSWDSGQWALELASTSEQDVLTYAAAWRQLLTPFTSMRNYFCTLPRRCISGFLLLLCVMRLIGLSWETVFKSFRIVWILSQPWLLLAIVLNVIVNQLAKDPVVVHMFLVSGTIAACCIMFIRLQLLADLTILELFSLGQLEVWHSIPVYAQVLQGLFATYGSAGMMYDFYEAWSALRRFPDYVAGVTGRARKLGEDAAVAGRLQREAECVNQPKEKHAARQRKK
eukprot:TRINITY_DN113230_c0_g1_i1.p1 TRINITY_DN113230_c0_g1~~TRINITY_DN113230_c0_g1_i1.p1  ORF type:complete len:512 (-),score=43.38 TRINITY_DN113230_c0_g1_i1:316-1851(-)